MDRKSVLFVLFAVTAALPHLAVAQAQAAATDTASACRKSREEGGQSKAVKVDTAPKSCLRSAQQLKGVTTWIDLRPSQDYASFHIPGASNQQLSQLLNQRAKGIAVYDGGRLSQDGELLCERLKRYGLTDVSVLEGGIAAWSQTNQHKRAADVSRLRDDEVSSALLAGRSPVIALSPGFQPVIATLPKAPPKAGSQQIVLAESASAVAAKLKQSRGTPTVLYWAGEPKRLQSLLQGVLTVDRKREAGPGYSPNCSAL